MPFDAVHVAAKRVAVLEQRKRARVIAVLRARVRGSAHIATVTCTYLYDDVENEPVRRPRQTQSKQRLRAIRSQIAH
jgi:hypothetical protein